MGGSPPAPPPAPSPTETANAQGAWNFATAAENQAGGYTNVHAPNLGDINYSISGYQTIQTPSGPQQVPQYTQNLSLSPGEQQLFDTSLSTQNTSADQAKKLLTNANYGDVPDGVGSATSGIMKQWLDKQQSYQDPLDTQARSRQDATLRNQGILPGSPAYDAQMRTLNDQISRNNTAAQQSFEPIAYSQAEGDYLRPLKLVDDLFGRGQATGATASATPPSAFSNQPVNYAGIVNSNYQNQMAGYNAQLQNQASQNAAMGSLLKTGIGGLGMFMG